jgi:sialic acid synthase SpsE/sugar phosphate isomerase/epimerase
MSFILSDENFWKSPKCYVIAEVGNNHNGSLARAKQMVDLAIEAGVDCVKFQMRNLAKVYRESSLKKTGDDLSAEYTIDLLKKFELTLSEHRELFDYCQKKKITYLCTPWDEDSTKELVNFGVEAFKVASADLLNQPLLECLVKTKKFLILSTGMAHEWEIKKVVNFLNEQKAHFALLHCNSTYPAPFHAINLNFISQLKNIHPKVGYSGHERGTSVSLGAVAIGAKIIERHFTLDRNMEGPDHAASLELKDFKALVDGIRELEQALGEGKSKELSQGELINRENLGKSLIAASKLPAGHVLKASDILVRSPGLGLSPIHLDTLIGKTLKRDVEKEDYFFSTDIEGTKVTPRPYKFNRPYGVPLRYHDFEFFYEKSKGADIVEFHLSYSDMDLDLSKIFKKTYPINFVVHAPELFKDSHLMDLATDDVAYRQFSMVETQKVINITRELKKYFPNTKCPPIVANVGGFSRDANFSEEQKTKLYDQFIKSMSELDHEGVEIIPQSMAPFPWHFGGQRYQNIFVMADEIANICKKNNMRICLDVSHSYLAANHFGFDFYEFVKTVAPYVAHLHLGDSKGVDGEGLQVGEGEMDFVKLGKILDEHCPKASFIPEIWQGHKNGGEGFWIALERLEKFFA